MLESLRKQTGSWVVKGFLGLLILSFAVWGIGDIFRGPSDAVVATVGEAEISRTDFSDAYRREMDRLSQQMGQRLDSEQARQLGVHNFTLQRMINRTLFDQVAETYGLTVTDADLANDIRTNPRFQNNVGRFDPLYYQDVLRQLGYSREYFEYVRRADLRRNQLMNSVALGADAPKPVVDAIYRYRAERRVADVAVVPASSIPEPADPDSAAIEKFHQDNAQRYMAPEYRALTYVTLTPEQLLKEVTVNESELQDEYEARLDEFIEPEVRDLSQIVLPDETAARDALEKLKQGAPFDDVARDTAGLEPTDTALGELRLEDLPFDPVAAAAIFAGAEGDILDPQQSDFGWHIYRVNKVVPGKTTSFEDAKEALRTQLALRRAADALFEMANGLEDELAGGATLEEAAGRLNLSARSVAQIDAGGRRGDGEAVAEIPPFPEFLRTAFETAEGQESNLTESSDRGYFIVRVDSVTPTAVKPLDSVRDQVIADWKSFERNRLAGERAKAIADRLRQGEDFQAVASAEGLTTKTTQPLSRFDARADTDVSGELLTKVFALKNTGDVTDAPTPQRNGHAIAVLRRIDTPDAGGTTQSDKDELRNSLRNALAEDFLAQYRIALGSNYDVEVNQSAVDSLF